MTDQVVTCHIAVVGRNAAGKILCSPRRRAPFAYLVSIGGSREREPAGYRNAKHRLRLVFEDAASEEEGGASRLDVERLVFFARRIDPAEGGVLVQCQAGISRSSAAAIVLMAVLLGPGREDEAVAHVRSVCHQARPNRRLLELADVVLETGGALMQAAGRAGPA